MGQVGLGPLRRAGFNVLTWDSRGFGESGGTVEVDSKDFEGRDVSALLDWLATQPEQQLDAPGDPRAGMTGASYAGGIELVSAGSDRRIDAIAPSIAWHSLLTALYRDDLVKGGWAAALSGLGIPTATALGIISPAGVQTGTVDPHITSAFTEGLATGHLSEREPRLVQSRGPGDALVSQIRVPTLLVQGTADTLFTPSEAIRNFELLKTSGVPLHMLWFCGGHGVCLTQGDNSRVEARIVGWLRRWLMGDPATDGDPTFEWLADDGQWRSAPDWPLAAGPAMTARGSGTLTFSPADTASSGLAVAATPSPDAVNVPSRRPRSTSTRSASRSSISPTRAPRPTRAAMSSPRSSTSSATSCSATRSRRSRSGSTACRTRARARWRRRRGHRARRALHAADRGGSSVYGRCAPRGASR